MYILGINTLHDTSVALLKDDKIIAAVEEERLNHQKHTTTFPRRSLEWLLKYENIELADIEHFATSFDFRLFQNNQNPFELNTILHDDASAEGQEKIRKDNNLLFQELTREMEKQAIDKYIHVEHHLAHAAAAYYLSGFPETNILVIDGRGETVSTSLLYGKDGSLDVIEQYSINDSLGHLYTYVTYLCGLYSNIGQEGKTMGLAPYGGPDPELERIFNKTVRYNASGYSINRNEMRKLMQYACPLGKINKTSMNLAFHVQKAYQETLLFLAKKMYRLTNCRNFALSGGVALNCEGNRLLLEQDFVDQVYVNPSANDGGSSLGAALYLYSTLKPLKPRSAETVYLGPAFTNAEVEKILRLSKVAYKEVKEPEIVAAKLVAEGKIIGWFQGPMEFGPRALGNRSILADPRSAAMKDKVNHFVKFRESWRPFAPAILLEHMGNYCDIFYEAPHMTISFKVKENKREDLPAAIHVDGTARIQTVSEKRNKKFYGLIKEFHELTGVPAVLNTSFNSHGYPIVCSPWDALQIFFSTGLDALVIESFLLQK